MICRWKDEDPEMWSLSELVSKFNEPASLFPSFIFRLCTPTEANSWTGNFVEVSGQNLESSQAWGLRCTMFTIQNRGGIQERTVGLRFLGIILRVLRLEVSTLVLCLSTRCSSWTDLSFLHWLIVLYGFLKP